MAKVLGKESVKSEKMFDVLDFYRESMDKEEEQEVLYN